MLIINRYLKRIAVLALVSILTSCSSSGGTSGGLGIDLSGQWRGNLFETNVGLGGGNIEFLIQNTNESVNVSLSLIENVRGTFSYNNALTNLCPLGGINGIIVGRVAGNTILFELENDGDGFTFAFSANVSNQRMEGDWNMTYEFEVDVGEDETETVSCGLNGVWAGEKVATIVPDSPNF